MKNTTILVVVLLSLIMVSCHGQTVSEVPPFVDTGVNPAAWANIPAGEFFSGQEDHVTPVDYSYEIMVTDVTYAQFAKFLNEAYEDGSIGFNGPNPVGYYPGDPFNAYKHEKEIPEGMYLLAALDDPGNQIHLQDGLFASTQSYSNHPVTFVTWFGARAYCAYYGWRLPSEIEWEKAARGAEDNRPFPWGDEIARNQANYYSSRDIFEKLANKSDTTPVGFYNGETYLGYTTLDHASPYGLYDMAGNVWQWTADIYPDQHYRYMRGGSKESYAVDLRIWKRNSAGPEYFSPNVGFRCVRDN